MYSLLVAAALLGGAPPQFVPTPPMRIESVYQDLERNRAVPIIPGTLAYPYQPLPSYPTPFSNFQSPYIAPIYPNFTPYYYYYRR